MSERDIKQMAGMTAEQRVEYIAAKLTSKKAARVRWMAESFDAAFGISA